MLDFTEFCENYIEKIEEKIKENSEYDFLFNCIAEEMYENYKQELAEQQAEKDIIDTENQLARDHEKGI